MIQRKFGNTAVVPAVIRAATVDYGKFQMSLK